MPERFLSDYPPTLTEAPRPRPRRVWYYWPALTFASVMVAGGVYAYWFEEAYWSAGVLWLVAAWLFGAIPWLERTR